MTQLTRYVVGTVLIGLAMAGMAGFWRTQNDTGTRRKHGAYVNAT